MEYWSDGVMFPDPTLQHSNYSNCEHAKGESLWLT